MQELSKAQRIAMYLKRYHEKYNTTNKVVQYCWDNDLCGSDIRFVKQYLNNCIKCTLY